MCRFLVYQGVEVLLADLLTKTEQSLIRQSYQARERTEPLNGDGFGVGWYDFDIAGEPCVFTSVTPAWSNRNLQRLADKIRSSCIFAHVRAASPGFLVSEVNCHPFQHGPFLFMHNGRVSDFVHIKRPLRESLSDDAYNLIEGTTDSEHVFALFLDRISKDDDSAEAMATALAQTILAIEELQRRAGREPSSHLNLAVTDGRRTVASRYTSRDDKEPVSLYLARGPRFEVHDSETHMRSDPNTASLIIASEPLTEERSFWERVPPNHFVIVPPDLSFELVPFGDLGR